MRVVPVAFDFETELIRPALLAPRPVCLTWQSPGEKAQIVHARDAESILRGWLLDPHVRLIGHNVAFDLAVVCAAFPALIPLIFDAYDADRVTDTMLRQQLIDIAGGRLRGFLDASNRFVSLEYSLEALARRIAEIVLQKDAWRLSYGRFLDVPLARWIERAKEVQTEARARLEELQRRPHGGKTSEEKALKKEIEGLLAMVNSPPDQCLRYPLDDARATLAVYAGQERHAHFLADQYRQACAAFAFHLSSAWGFRTDGERVEALRSETEAHIVDLEAELKSEGLVRATGSRDTKEAKARMVRVCREACLPIPRTDAHFSPNGREVICELGDACEEHVSLQGEACNAVEDYDHVLPLYGLLSTAKKILSNDVEALKRGVVLPVHTRYGMAETGRATSSGPNIQNWMRGRKCRACGGTGEREAA